MKITHLAGALCALASTAICQIAIPPHASTYNGFSRGFNFTAKTTFLINKLDLPPNAKQTGDTASYMIHVNGAEVLRSVGNAGALTLKTPLLIFSGNVVDIIGNWSPRVTSNFSAHNSYGNTAPYNTTIQGVAHVLNRVGWQWDIGDPAYKSGSMLTPGAGSIGRVLVHTAKAIGVFAEFSATPRSGLGATKVQFTDLSYTSDPGGIVTRLWDLDGDGKTDSTAKNPSFTYTKAGLYDVTLQAIAKNGNSKKTKKGFINIIFPDPKDRTIPDIIQYQLNDVRGKVSNVVVNSASGTVGNGTMNIAANFNWAGDPGRAAFNPNEKGFGMVQGGTTAKYITSGWNLNAKSMTVMFWLRNNSTSTNPFGYCFGRSTGAGSFRCFIAGAAGNGIRLAAAAPIGNFDSGGDLVTNKNGVWQHICLVIDDAAGKAFWYADGLQLNTKSFTPNSFGVSGTGFTVGGYTATGSTTISGGAGAYDWDDFRFYSKALTPAQVAAAALFGENASASTYGTACASTSATAPKIAANGLPTQGNFTFRVNVTGCEANALGAMIVSFQAASPGLPLDISAQTVAGCKLEVLPTLFYAATTSATGTYSLGLPVHIDPVNLPGFHAYCQFGYVGKTKTGITQGLDINVQ
ncbi:MAG: LamG-like jellyroll fold domain-containing protein [Planctomycetota bacterium]|jgi:PKD repeat protein